MKLSGKIVAVTDGANGIGEAAARQRASEGATVVLGDVDIERGRSVAVAICSTGERAELQLVPNSLSMAAIVHTGEVST